jgi:hypothetical protein
VDAFLDKNGFGDFKAKFKEEFLTEMDDVRELTEVVHFVS